jgi:hypothetical protein
MKSLEIFEFIFIISITFSYNNKLVKSQECDIESEKYAGQKMYATTPNDLVLCVQCDFVWILDQSYMDKKALTIRSKLTNEYLCASNLFEYENRFRNHKTSQKRLLYTLLKRAKKDPIMLRECKWRLVDNPGTGSYMFANDLYGDWLYSEQISSSVLSLIKGGVYLKPNVGYQSGFKWKVKCLNEPIIF